MATDTEGRDDDGRDDGRDDDGRDDDAADGSVRFQDPSTSRPRPPSVGEQRARDQARRRRESERHAEQDAAAAARRRRTRLIGGAAVVGIVGLVAVAYVALAPQDVTARCTDGSGVVVEDRFCSGSPGSAGLFIVAGGFYRYNYGGVGGIGQQVSGGSTVRPQGANISTPSGTSVQRGGLGSRSGGGS